MLLKPVAEGAEIIAGARPGYIYGRSHNPTQEILEDRLADLEGAEAGLAFASGMGAVCSTMLTFLSAGDRLVAHHTLYSNTHALVTQALPRYGIEVVLVDFTDPAAVSAAINPDTRLIYLETPANPTVEIIDIEAIAAARGESDVPIIVDSTFASPALQRPIEHGADLVLHSLTKIHQRSRRCLGRRGGRGCGSGGTGSRPWAVRYITGAVISPMSAYFVLRGMKTLAVRMRQHGENALALAQLLEQHPKVAWVRYPGLASHPGHAIAKRQMSNGGAMMSFGLKSGFEGAARLLDGLTLISRAVSLGDAESLIIHPASLLQGRAAVHTEETLTFGLTDDLIRFSIGLETIDDLQDDLRQALDRV